MDNIEKTTQNAEPFISTKFPPDSETIYKGQSKSDWLFIKIRLVISQ